VTPKKFIHELSLFREERIMPIHFLLTELRGIYKHHTQFYVNTLSKIFKHWMNKMSYYQQTTEFMGTPTASGILSFSK